MGFSAFTRHRVTVLPTFVCLFGHFEVFQFSRQNELQRALWPAKILHNTRLSVNKRAARPDKIPVFPKVNIQIYILAAAMPTVGETEVRAQGDFLNNTGTQPWFKDSFFKATSSSCGNYRLKAIMTEQKT